MSEERKPDEIDRAIEELTSGEDVANPALVIKVSMPHMDDDDVGEDREGHEHIRYFSRITPTDGRQKVTRVEGWMIEVARGATMAANELLQRLSMMLMLQTVQEDRDRRRVQQKMKKASESAAAEAVKITKES